MGAMGTTLDCTFQLVAQRASSKGEKMGRPVFQRMMPESCQPPSTPLTTLLESARSQRPRPMGTCQMKFALMLWRTALSGVGELLCCRGGVGVEGGPAGAVGWGAGGAAGECE